MPEKKIYESHAQAGRYKEMSVAPAVTQYYGTGGGNVPLNIEDCAVRRLTPAECEALQGLPRGWTDVPYHGKEHAPDTQRYKAVGNSFAAPVVRWIAQRILEVDRG